MLLPRVPIVIVYKQPKKPDSYNGAAKLSADTVYIFNVTMLLDLPRNNGMHCAAIHISNLLIKSTNEKKAVTLTM